MVTMVRSWRTIFGKFVILFPILNFNAFNRSCSSLYNIEYKDLASLSDNDLKQFGVSDVAKRRLLLDDFSEMLNQNEHYDK